MPNALAVVAMAEAGSLLNAPDAYMDKIALGGNFPDDIVYLDATPKENVKAVAKAKGVGIELINVWVLDRPRHADMIAQVRECGARVTLITDGAAQKWYVVPRSAGTDLGRQALQLKLVGTLVHSHGLARGHGAYEAEFCDAPTLCSSCAMFAWPLNG